jgi:ubiquinone/menaquinone biosynthesis C-methylase UbiE
VERGYREASLASWETSAAGWAYWARRLSEASRDVTEWLLGSLDLRDGDTILELAAGAGDLGYEASARADVRLLTTDFSEPMLAEARRRAEEVGVPNAEFRVLDAEDLDLPDDSVDGVLCRYGYMLMADCAAALRETRRVLRPGRRVAFATWGRPEANAWVMFGRILVERGLMPGPEPGEPGIFGLPEAADVEPLLVSAGFDEVESEVIDFVLDYPSFEGYWDFVTRGAGAVTPVLAAMSEDELADYQRELAERVAPFLRPDGTLAFPASSLAVASTA